ncbi:MAG: hypothetical protein JWO98_2606 [Frankiales bacterium]|nr:hypothetical protein [Frankiales bacterium]
MSNATEDTRQVQTDTRAVPPMVGCPTWCHGGHDAWKPDGDEFATDHHSAQLASPGASYSLTLYAIDWFHNGTLEIDPGCPVLQLEDEILQPEDATLLADDLARVNAMAADTRRRVRERCDRSERALTEAGVR